MALSLPLSCAAVGVFRRGAGFVVSVACGAKDYRGALTPSPLLSPTITGPTTPGLKRCQPASPIDNSPVGPEVQGTATNAELWALIQLTSGIPPVAKTEVKIVWRMTGSDDFAIVALSPAGMQVSPTQGPEPHLGSNWNRPGDEWGTVFIFPVAGCWDLHATRGNAFGDVWIKIIG
jgi:hypothetical protein